MRFNWRAILGPALTTATALTAFLVDRHLVPVPNPAPLFVCIVALASSISGIVSITAPRPATTCRIWRGC